MRQQFEEHGRDFGYTGFEIGFVPHASAVPLRFISLSYVVGDLCQYDIGEITRNLSGSVFPIGLFPFSGKINS